MKPHVKIDKLVNLEYIYCIDPNKINLNKLSNNNAIMAKLFLEKYPDKIDWSFIAINTSKWAYKLLKNNLDEIDWDYFSSSPYLFKIIKTNYKQFDILLHKKLT